MSTSRASSVLHVLMSGRPAGWLRRDARGKVSLEYDEKYVNDPVATPLSVVLPFSSTHHSGPVLNSWLAGLLPDNSAVLENWGRRFQVSPSSPYSLLAHVGSDCAGAVQFLPEDTNTDPSDGYLQPLTNVGVGQRLRELAADPSAWTPSQEAGQFSLAGAQAKTALRLENGEWALPWGREPTSHLLKLPIANLHEQHLNEHLCLRTSRSLGLPAAESQLLSFSGLQVLVVTRYDRVRDSDGQLIRVHQEDICQALGIPPSRKYQADQGPGPVDVVRLLRRVMGPEASSIAIERFVRALAMSWLFAGTDAHAKNYSLLLSGTQVRLAPLYDLNSALPYLTDERRDVPLGNVSRQRARLAMSLGGRSRLNEIDRTAWLDFAIVAGLNQEETIAVVGNVVEQAPTALEKVTNDEFATGLLTPGQKDFAERLLSLAQKHSRLCVSALAGRVLGSRRRRPVNDL